MHHEKQKTCLKIDHGCISKQKMSFIYTDDKSYIHDNNLKKTVTIIFLVNKNKSREKQSILTFSKKKKKKEKKIINYKKKKKKKKKKKISY